MITESMTPQFDGEEPKKPFDIYEGHNFNIRVRSDASRGGLASYDKSFFEDRATELASNDAELEKIYNAMVNLDEYLQVGRLSQADLEKKAIPAYGGVVSTSSAFARSEENDIPECPVKPFNKLDPLPWDEEPAIPSESLNSEEEDALEYFKKLASE
jgi:hypothetical protein